MGRQRVDLQEAAELLGITSDAVRKRAKRGNMPYETGVDGKLYVWVDAGRTGADEAVVGDQDQAVPDRYVQSLEEQIAFLRRELEARTEEARRKDHIIMSLTQRVPELEAASEPRESPETPAEHRSGTDAPADAGEAQEGAQTRRSWWRRFFGFE